MEIDGLKRRMKLQKLNCPACGRPIEAEHLQSNQIFTCPACHTSLALTGLSAEAQILCPQCKTVNAASERFCDNCGATLTQNCPFCYTANTVTAEHCRNCGANLRRAKKRKDDWLARQQQHTEARRAALEKALDEERQARLQQLLDDLDEPENHPMAIHGLRQFGSEAVDALIEHLKDEDPDARFGAARTLGLLNDARAGSALTEALGDEEPAVRYWAANALGRLRTEKAIEALGRLLQDKHKGVRTQASEALQNIGGPKAEKILRQNSRRWWQF